MEIEKKRLKEPLCQNSLVVVIDVLRAFTTAAFAFGGGAKKIFVTSTVKEALELHSRYPKAFLIGEENGIGIDRFHFDNSPAQVYSADLRDATLIHRTTCGTQGLLLANQAGKVFAASTRPQKFSKEFAPRFFCPAKRGARRQLASSCRERA